MDEISRILEEAWKQNKMEAENGGHDFADVLIMGPTGTGKSAVIEEWLKKHSEDIQPYYILANTRPVPSWINGMEIYFGSNELERLDRKNVVMIIDHFDLTRSEARKHLLDLVANRKAVVRLDGQETPVYNLKLIVATAWSGSHFGYEELSEEDIKAFKHVIRYK